MGLLAREAAAMRVECAAAYPDPDAGLPWAAGATPGVCFLDVCSDRERAVRLVSRISKPPFEIPVVVVLSEGNHELALRCLRNGACGCLVRPFNQEQLQPVLLRIGSLAAEPEPGGRGRVLCIAPAKGSCGATTLAVNLAFHSRRTSFDRVLLADLDPIAGTLAFVLKLKSHHSFVDALAHAGDLDAELWKGLVVACRDCDVLLAPHNPLDCMVETGDASGLVNYARCTYDLLILDTGGVGESLGLEAAKLSDEVVLVTTSELAAVHAAKRWIAYLGANGVGKSRIRLVVSRWRRDLGLDREQIEAALGLAVLHVLPSDSQPIEDALIEGRPVASGSLYAKSLTELAERLLGCQAPAVKVAPRKGLRALFSR
jgi:Flp pilus assembly CpaE family ATPase